MKWGSSTKYATYTFNCAICTDFSKSMNPYRFTSASTPASCPSCGVQLTSVNSSTEFSRIVDRVKTEQLHLRIG